MRAILISLAFLFTCPSWSATIPTASELIALNLKAKGGLDKIKAIKSLRSTGTLQQRGFSATVGEESRVPNLLRQTFTMQGMTEIEAYDGSAGWKISPFEGRKDPELVGEEELRDLVENADFYGPLVDYKEKGSTVEYLGMDTVDGDDAHRLKVTLKNGDIFYYYLDPATYLEIKREKMQFVRGAVRESAMAIGSYKRVAGVYFPFSFEFGSKSDTSSGPKVTIERLEANVDIPDAKFKMPAAPAAGGKK